MHASSQATDVVVAGGGFAGLVTAAALARAGFTVTALEPLSGPTEALRGELLHPPGVRALAALELDGALREAGAVEVEGFAAYRSAGAQPVMLPYPIGVGLGLEHREIVGALRREVGGLPSVRLVQGVRVEDVLAEGGRVVGVRCSDGSEVRAALVVAADGRHSRLRKALAIPTQATLLSYSVAATLERDLLPVPSRGHVFVGAPGPILAYPFGRDRVRMNIDVPLAAAKGREAIVRYIRERYASFVPAPLAQAMLEALENRPFQACANHAIYTQACVVPGAALVGDAGGCSHPLSATGMTATLNDALALADCLSHRGLGDRALLAYQRRRYRFVRAREVFAQALYEVLRGAGPGPRALREGVFRYWQDERARRASMALLAGDESAVTTFVSEYGRVLGLAGWEACSAALLAGSVRDLSQRVGSLAATAWECGAFAAHNVVETLRVGGTRSLRPVDLPRLPAQAPEAERAREDLPLRPAAAGR